MSTIKNYAMNEAAINAELALADMGIEKTDTQTDKPKAKRKVKANTGNSNKKAPRPANAKMPVSSDTEMSASETMAASASEAGKNTQTMAQREMSMNSAIVLYTGQETSEAASAPLVDKPEPEMNGQVIGKDHDKAQLARMPKIAGKIRLCAIEKTDEYQEMTTTTISFAPLYLVDKRLPVTVQYRTHRLYNNGETRISALHKATGKNAMIDRMYFASEATKDQAVYVGETLNEYVRFAYKSIVAGFLRLDNAIAHVTGQIERGEKLQGHDETLRGTTSKFLLNFAKAELKKEKTGMSEAEFTAKAQANAAMMAETLRNETEK